VRWRGSVLVALALLLPGCSAGAADTAAPATTSSGSAARTTPSTTAPPPSTTPPSTTPPVTATTTAGSPAADEPPPTVVLDPGHNGGNAARPERINAPVPDGAGGTKPCNTTGTETNAGYPEHAFTWDVALRVRDRLEAAGVEVALTRPNDESVGPCVDARGRLAGMLGARAFVGIHGDGAAPGGRGFHVITSSLNPAGPAVAADSRSLAMALRDSMAQLLPVSTYLGSNGLDARSDLAGLNLNAVPAVYVECGNMRNATDAALMSSPDGRQQIADRLAAGVLAFLGS
jgi:N-acetylmuramoyl-L-alanine amidase